MLLGLSSGLGILLLRRDGERVETYAVRNMAELLTDSMSIATMGSAPVKRYGGCVAVDAPEADVIPAPSTTQATGDCFFWGGYKEFDRGILVGGRRYPRLEVKDYSARTESAGDCTSPSASSYHACRLLHVCAFRSVHASLDLVDRDLTNMRPHTAVSFVL